MDVVYRLHDEEFEWDDRKAQSNIWKGDVMNELQETSELRVRHRPHTSIAIDMPADVLETLTEVADERDMSVEALIRFYIGRCLREDRPRMYASMKKRDETPEAQTATR